MYFTVYWSIRMGATIIILPVGMVNGSRTILWVVDKNVVSQMHYSCHMYHVPALIANVQYISPHFFGKHCVSSRWGTIPQRLLRCFTRPCTNIYKMFHKAFLLQAVTVHFIVHCRSLLRDVIPDNQKHDTFVILLKTLINLILKS